MSFTDSVYVIMFSSGLLGGFGHCIGMCGPVVVAYSVRAEPRGILPQMLFHLGRITTYCLIGGIMGLTGSYVNVVRSIERLQTLTMATIGIIMIIMGLGLGGWLPITRNVEQSGWISNIAVRAAKSLNVTKDIGIWYPMGMMLGFMPCGLLYTAFIAAAGAGVDAATQVKGLLQGMLMLLLFGLGTLPSLLFLGRIVSLQRVMIRRNLYKGSAVLMIVAGIVFLYRSLHF